MAVKKRKTVKGKDGLSPRLEKFCLEFRRHNSNATQAAIAAGYSRRTASAAGARLVKDARVQARLCQLMEDADRKLIMPLHERQRILSELARDGNVDWDVRVKAIDILNKIDGAYRLKLEVEVDVAGFDRLKEKLKCNREREKTIDVEAEAKVKEL